MMTHIRKWVLAACSALLLISYSTVKAQGTNQLDPSQTYYTGNLVNSTTSPTDTTGTWQNIGLWNQGLPCWQPGDPVYCGPKPFFNNGSFNFSYGTTDVYQIVNIANALPNTGTGLRVNGYYFGFTAKNGNGWDNGMVDQLTAYVSFNDPSNQVIYNKNYNLNYQFNWSNFGFSETFNTPFAAKDLSTVTYGFIGRDNNGWAGPYGPEIYNVNFSLKYSVDPCAVDVMSSPSCPGYLDAINKLTAPTTTTTTTTATTAPATTTTVAAPTSPTSTVSETTQPATTTVSNTTTVAAPVVTSSTATISVTPTATNPQPKIGEVTVSGSPAKTTMSTSQLLSIVKNEQSRIGNLETSTAQQAVEQAQAAGDKAQKDSVSISMATVSQSQASSQAIASMFSSNPSQMNSSTSAATSSAVNSSASISVTPSPVKSSTVEVLKAPEINTGVVNQTSIVSKSVEVKMPEPPQVVADIQQPTTTKPQSIYSLTGPTYSPPAVAVSSQPQQLTYVIAKVDTTKFQFEEQSRSEGIKVTGVSPIMNIINSTPTTSTTVSETSTGPVVNAKVKDNDLSGGVSLASIANQPKGFESYMGILPDTSFYSPKEIYRNQKVVDNARAQRLLNGASDRLHQEMVLQQYNQGK